MDEREVTITKSYLCDWIGCHRSFPIPEAKDDHSSEAHTTASIVVASTPPLTWLRTCASQNQSRCGLDIDDLALRPLRHQGFLLT